MTDITEPAAPKKQYAIMRFGKITGPEALRRVSNHNTRAVHSENVQIDGPPPRELLDKGSDDFVKSANDLLDELDISRASTKDKVLAVEAVVSASRAWFDNTTAAEKDEWCNASVKWAHKKFGRGLLTAKLHEDEEVWHIHFVALPVVNKQQKPRGRPPRCADERRRREEEWAKKPAKWTLSYHDVLGGAAERLSEEQDTYHAAVQHLGLARGEKQRNDITIELGDELTMAVTRLARGLDENGQSRPRRSLAPQEYRQEIKRLKQEAEAERRRAAEAQRQAEIARVAAEQERARCQEAADQAVAARAAAERTTVEAAALREAAERERRAALAEKEQLSLKRHELEAEQQRRQAELALLLRATDESSELNLRPQDNSFAMGTARMSDREREVYTGSWTALGIKVGTILAKALERLRQFANQLRKREFDLIDREASLDKRGRTLGVQEQQLVEQQQRMIADREATLGQIRVQQKRLAEREAAVEKIAVVATAKLTEARSKEGIAIAEEQRLQQWSTAVELIASGMLPAAPSQNLRVCWHPGVDPSKDARFAKYVSLFEQRPPYWVIQTLNMCEAANEEIQMAQTKQEQVDQGLLQVDVVLKRVQPLLTSQTAQIAETAKIDAARIAAQFRQAQGPHR